MTETSENPEMNVRDLSEVPEGETVRLVKIDGGRSVQSRLAALGLMAGVRLRVVRNDRRGPFIVEVKGSRVILGRGMVSGLQVA